MERKDPEARKQELLEAALRLFDRHGYDAMRVDDILSEVGISKGGFYHHFKSKEAVLREAVHREQVNLLSGLETTSDEVDPVEGLLAVFEKGSVSLGAGEGVLSTLQSFQARTIYLDQLEIELEQHLKPYLQQLIRTGVEHSVFRSVNPEATAEIFFAVNNHGNRQAILKQLDQQTLAQFNATAIGLLGLHLGIEEKLAPIVTQLMS